MRLIAVTLFLLALNAAANEPPLLTNIRFYDDPDQQVLTIRYDVDDAEDDSLEILFRASFDEGNKFLVNTANATGHVGFPVMRGADRELHWHYGDVWDIIEGKSVRLVADDRQPLDLAALVEQVDSNRLRSMVEFIAHPRSFQTDREHLYRVRDSITALLEGYGYRNSNQEFGPGHRLATNVIGRKPGLGNERSTYIIDAHYDGNIDTPGADDNASGVAGFLEAARLLAPYSFDKSIEIIGFDQEEEGLVGSINYAFLGGIEPWKEVAGVLNFEMIGFYSERPNTQQAPLGFDLLFPSQYGELEADSFRGNFIFVAGNDASIDLVNAYEQAAATYVPGLKLISAIVPLNGIIAPDLLRSDHAPFWFKGLPAVMITDGSEFRNTNYHELSDVVDSLNFTFMRQVTQAALATLAELAGPRHATVQDLVVEFLATPVAESLIGECRAMAYPNPASDLVRIGLPDCLSATGQVQARLLDVSGRLVREYRASGREYRLDVSGLPCGQYLLELESTEGRASAVLLVQ